MNESRVQLVGSFRPELGDELTGRLDPSAVVEATLVLRRRAEPGPAVFGGPALSRDELAERFGADPADIEAVVQAVSSSGAEVVSADAASRLVRVRGTAAALGAMFGTTLHRAGDAASGTRRRSGELSVPVALAEPLIAVLGLDDRAQASVRYRAARAVASSVSYTPLQLASAYRFPDGDGTGQSIAIIELGGGFAASDLDSYFGGLGLSKPDVVAVSVDGAENAAGEDPDGADGEVLLDIEVAGAIAPAASLLVYFAPNTDDGFVDAITQAAHATPAPTAMSISWGQSEDEWTPQARQAMTAAIADATLLGVTVTVAAGDNGSSDAAGGASSATPHADFPASCPQALACGGTSLRLAGDGTIASEVVWNDGGQGGSTGGGVSDAFPLPEWQVAAGVPVRDVSDGMAGRGVPDVAAVADPETGYQVLIDGNAGVIGGTSAVAPLWAGLVCRLAQDLGAPLGLLSPKLYAGSSAGKTAPGFRDITQGSNGVYDAGPGWDACTGLGVADGSALLEVLRTGTS